MGASRVRDLFARAKKEAPSIIFIDEVRTRSRTGYFQYFLPLDFQFLFHVSDRCCGKKP